MKKLILITCALVLASCASQTPPFPNKRPLTQEGINAIGKTGIVVIENPFGVSKGWHRKDNSSGASSLEAALVASIIDSIANARPAGRARKVANAVGEFVKAPDLDASLVSQFTGQITPADAPVGEGITFGSVTTRQRILMPAPMNDVIELATTYTISLDASVLLVEARASYLSSALVYSTPYTFAGKVPKSERSGPVYTNTFKYYSNQIPIPAMSPELQEDLAAAITQSYQDKKGAPPAPGSGDFRAMTKYVNYARDARLAPSELAIFREREWTRDEAALLKAEIDKAHAFIAKYLLLDLNTTAVPSLTGADEVLEMLEHDRIVRRIGTGVDSGTYVSSTGEFLGNSIFGNAIMISEEQSNRLRELQKQASKAKAAAQAKLPTKARS